MRLKKDEKAKMVTALQDSLQGAQGFILTDHTGLTVPQIQDLRRRLTDARVRYQVVKNTLLRRALQAVGRDELEAHLFGATSVALISDDPVAAAKALDAFVEEVGRPSVKAGWIDGQLLLAEAVKELASVPGREQLQSHLVGLLQGGAAGLVMLLQAPLRDLVVVCEAYATQSGAGAVPAPDTNDDAAASVAGPEGLQRGEAPVAEALDTADTSVSTLTEDPTPTDTEGGTTNGSDQVES